NRFITYRSIKPRSFLSLTETPAKNKQKSRRFVNFLVQFSCRRQCRLIITIAIVSNILTASTYSSSPILPPRPDDFDAAASSPYPLHSSAVCCHPRFKTPSNLDVALLCLSSLPFIHRLTVVIRLIVIVFILGLGFFFGFVFGRMGRRDDSDRAS